MTKEYRDMFDDMREELLNGKIPDRLQCNGFDTLELAAKEWNLGAIVSDPKKWKGRMLETRLIVVKEDPHKGYWQKEFQEELDRMRRKQQAEWLGVPIEALDAKMKEIEDAASNPGAVGGKRAEGKSAPEKDESDSESSIELHTDEEGQGMGGAPGA